MHTILAKTDPQPEPPSNDPMSPEQWEQASRNAKIAAKRVPPAEWHTDAKLKWPDELAKHPNIPQLNYTWQHFIDVGTYDSKTVYLGADGNLYMPMIEPVDFKLLPSDFIGKHAAEHLIADLARFYKLSDEHDRLYGAIEQELLRISDWRLFARTGFRRYAEVFIMVHRVGDGCRRRFVRGGEADYYNNLRVCSIEGLGYLIDEKGRLVAYSNHQKRLTVVEPCEIFALSDLRRIHGRLEAIR